MELTTPGVYVREVDSGPKPIQAASTSVAAFLGVFRFHPRQDAVALLTAGVGGEAEHTVDPALVGLDGSVRDVSAALSALGLERRQVRDLKGWLSLHGHDVKVARAGDQVRLSAGKDEQLLVAPELVSPAGKVLVRDAVAVEALLAEVEQVFPLAAPQARTASELLAPWERSLAQASGTSSVQEFALPAWPITGKGELQRWLQSTFAQLVVETRPEEVFDGAVPADPEEAADRVFDALQRPGRLQERFETFLSEPSIFRFVAAVQGFFDNGGGKAWVHLLGVPDPAGSIAGDPVLRSGLRAFDDLDEVALVAAPGLSAAQQAEVLEHCEARKDRFAVLDGPPVSLGDVPVPASDRGFGALYLPWVRVARPAWLRGEVELQVEGPLRRKLVRPARDEVAVPPSGHVAGIMARVDAERGVHKAPANEVLRGIRGLTQAVSHAEQGAYNQRGINVLRDLGDRGLRVWGARTLATASNPEWRYVNVRRLFIMLEQSILAGSQWAVFEPNDALLWSRLRRDVTAFLLRQWRAGALFGRTAEEAFFVRCDEETNPRYLVDAGQVTVRIGVSPVKPAEFVVFHVGQWDGGSSLTE